MKKTFLASICAALMFAVVSLISAAPAAALDRPSCDAPLAQKLLAGGCNTAYSSEHEFTKTADRNQAEPPEAKKDDESEAEGTEDTGAEATDNDTATDTGTDAGTGDESGGGEDSSSSEAAE